MNSFTYCMCTWECGGSPSCWRKKIGVALLVGGKKIGVPLLLGGKKIGVPLLVGRKKIGVPLLVGADRRE